MNEFSASEAILTHLSTVVEHVAGNRDLGEVLELLQRSESELQVSESHSGVARILLALQDMARSRDRRIQELLERKRLEHEMSVAREVLHHFLPAASWQAGELTLGGWLRPADWVGGDCYDYFPVESGVGFLLADACGHGLGSTLLAAETRTLVRALLFDRSLSCTANRSNLMLYDDTASGRFVTAFFGTIDEDGLVRYVCAGQAPIFHYQAKSGQCAERGTTGPPLGVLRRADFIVEELRLEPGDRLLVPTDGVADWGRESGSPYGYERVQAMVKLQAHQPCDALLAALAKDVQSHAAQNLDDATVLAICRGSACD